jgi:hypothetical protein
MVTPVDHIFVDRISPAKERHTKADGWEHKRIHKGSLLDIVIEANSKTDRWLKKTQNLYTTWYMSRGTRERKSMIQYKYQREHNLVLAQTS